MSMIFETLLLDRGHFVDRNKKRVLIFK